MEEQNFEVRDMRHKEKFYVDDAYLNGYAKILGTTTSMVYFVLCRHSDKVQVAFPSYEYIADKLGISSATVKRSIKLLKEWNIIKVEKGGTNKNGQFLHNIYHLLDKKTWKKKPEVTNDPRIPWVTHDPDQGSLVHPAMGHPRPTKETHIEGITVEGIENVKTFSDMVIEIMEIFKTTINPTLDYGNKTQRSACEYLIETVGIDEVIGAAKFAVLIQNKKYAPVITSPLQLKNKYGELKSYGQKMKESKGDAKLIKIK